MCRILCLCATAFICFSKISAQSVTNASPLTIEQIMQGEKFVGSLPDNIRWSPDSRTIYFDWNPDGDTISPIYKISVNDGKGGAPVKMTDEEANGLFPSGTKNKAGNKMTYDKNGDLFLVSFIGKTGKPENLPTLKTQITNTLDWESSPAFSEDEAKIIFEKTNNLFSWDPKTGVTEQLTDFRKGHDKVERKKSAQDQWLEKDQLAMFEILTERKAESEAQKRRREALKPKRPKPIYIGDKRISGIQATPNMRFVTFILSSDNAAEQTEVPNYVTESGKVETLRSRPKVGEGPTETELGIYDRERDTVYFVETKNIEGIYDKPFFLKEYHRDTLPYEEKYKKPRPVNFIGPLISEEGKALLVIKSQDSKDRWLMHLDLPSGNMQLLDHQHDEAWIGGPGIDGWSGSMGNIGWLPGSKTAWFQSEGSGWSHLYTVNIETGEKKALTSGKFEILDVSLSDDKRFFYLNSNKETPFEHHFYKMPVTGGVMEKITSMPGNHQVTMSPDEKWLAVLYSFSNKPWELFLQPNRAGSAAVQLTQSTSEEFRNYPWRVPEMVWFKASDGVDVPARLYRPKAGLRNGGAVIFVHGAGYLQNVHHWWSSYYREYMFHNLLTDNGFTVLDIDYRGSQGYGRDWRTGIYRHMGGKDLSDHVDGAKFLSEQHGIDPERIGIYGGSYGGFITLMAMFTSPGTFKSGAALRSVTDWAHYNHGYTANILNTPVEDSLAYRRSSPIYYAEGLQGNLLILHGMIDTNVQFQDVVRLAQRLVELKKDRWEFAVFPLESHGFLEPSSWTDEYRRIYELFWKTLRE